MSCTTYKGVVAVAAAVFLLPANAILVRYSKRHPASDREYLSYTVNAMNELIKMSLSLVMYFVFKDTPDMVNAPDRADGDVDSAHVHQDASAGGDDDGALDGAAGGGGGSGGGGGAGGTRRAWRSFVRSLPYALPAIMYLIDNNVFYTVMLFINPATFSLMNNVKIIFVALLFRFALHRTITRIQWISLILLVVGLVVSELDALHPPVMATAAAICVNATAATASSAADATVVAVTASPSRAPVLPILGPTPAWFDSGAAAVAPVTLLAAAESAGGVVPASAVPAAQVWLAFALVCVMCLSSAIGNIAVEHLYKTRTQHMMLQNAQLYGWGHVLNVACLLVRDWSTVVGPDGPFVGFTPIVWAIVWFAALSGLSVAFILKYSDNIGNIWAHAAALVLTALISAVLFSFEITLAFVCGCVIVKLCAYLYHVSSHVDNVDGQEYLSVASHAGDGGVTDVRAGAGGSGSALNRSATAPGSAVKNAVVEAFDRRSESDVELVVDDDGDDDGDDDDGDDVNGGHERYASVEHDEDFDPRAASASTSAPAPIAMRAVRTVRSPPKV